MAGPAKQHSTPNEEVGGTGSDGYVYRYIFTLFQVFLPRELLSCQLSRYERVACTQPTIHSPRLSIHIATFITAQKQRDPRDFIRISTPLQRVQLPNLPLRASLPCRVVHALGHTRLNHARANGIYANFATRKLVSHCRGHVDDRGFGGRVGGRAGVGANPRDGGRHDNASTGRGLFSGGLGHGTGRVLCRQKWSEMVSSAYCQNHVGWVRKQVMRRALMSGPWWPLTQEYSLSTFP